ncbi:phosphatase PAP2 family protein [Pedobacter sp. GSP4]|uniref:phosphatase PAP2 family protein n=1 Tax=Pedobacter sp. GSP4 TaxID=3453716 RepID=UPI003EED50D8
MIKRIKRLPLYFIGLALILLSAVIICCSLSKAESFFVLNSYHNPFLDLFFRLFTNLGDGLLSILLGISLLILKKRKKAITLLLAYFYSSLLAQIVKNLLDRPRPRLYLEQMKLGYSNFVSGINLHDHHSFPSGHTTSAFALVTVLVLVYKKRKISIPCLLLATAIGYSRIYLAQHFLIDVICGAMIGSFSALLAFDQVYVQKLFRPAKAIMRLKRLRKIEPSAR